MCGEEVTRCEVQSLQGFLAAKMGEVGRKCVSEDAVAAGKRGSREGVVRRELMSE